MWFSQTRKLLIKWGLPFFLRFRCPPSLGGPDCGFRDREILAKLHHPARLGLFSGDRRAQRRCEHHPRCEGRRIISKAGRRRTPSSLRAPRRIKASSAQFHPHWSVPLRGPIDRNRVRAREAPQEAFFSRRRGASEVQRLSLKDPWIPADQASRSGFRERQFFRTSKRCGKLCRTSSRSTTSSGWSRNWGTARRRKLGESTFDRPSQPNQSCVQRTGCATERGGSHRRWHLVHGEDLAERQ